MATKLPNSLAGLSWRSCWGSCATYRSSVLSASRGGRSASRYPPAAFAALRFASTESGTVSNIIAVALLALATLVITGLFVFTLVELGKGGLRALST